MEGTQSDEHIKSYFTAIFSTSRERGSMAFLETIENRLSDQMKLELFRYYTLEEID